MTGPRREQPATDAPAQAATITRRISLRRDFQSIFTSHNLLSHPIAATLGRRNDVLNISFQTAPEILPGATLTNLDTLTAHQSLLDRKRTFTVRNDNMETRRIGSAKNPGKIHNIHKISRTANNKITGSIAKTILFTATTFKKRPRHGDEILTRTNNFHNNSLR